MILAQREYRRYSIFLEFELGDLWIGLFCKIKPKALSEDKTIHLYLCIVPMFPIHVMVDVKTKAVFGTHTP